MPINNLLACPLLPLSMPKACSHWPLYLNFLPAPRFLRRHPTPPHHRSLLDLRLNSGLSLHFLPCRRRSHPPQLRSRSAVPLSLRRCLSSNPSERCPRSRPSTPLGAPSSPREAAFPTASRP